MRFQYLLTQTAQSIRRNPLVVASAIVAVLVTLVLVFGAIVLRWSIDEDIGRWDDNVRVIAFLSDDLGPDRHEGTRGSVTRSWSGTRYSATRSSASTACSVPRPVGR